MIIQTVESCDRSSLKNDVVSRLIKIIKIYYNSWNSNIFRILNISKFMKMEVQGGM